MDDKKSPRLRFNLFDALLIVLVLAVLGGALLLRNRSTGTELIRTTTPVRVTVELASSPVELGEHIHVGDDVFRSTDNTYLGKVQAVRSVPHRAVTYSQLTGRYVVFDCEDTADVYVTVEGEGYYTKKALILDTVEARVGSELPLKGKGFAHMGYVYSVDPMQAVPPENTDTGAGELEVTYVFCFESVRNVLTDCMHVGDRFYEKSTGAYMGVVTDVWTEPYGVTMIDAEEKPIYVEREDSSFVYIRLKGRAVEKQDGYYLDGGTELKVGATAHALSMYSDRIGTYYRLESVERAS